jgi:ADP-ribosyl-[dinitrogen reductase] hydrolase
MSRSRGWRERAAGVLLASAAGDALGAGYEFTHPAPDMTIDMIGGGPFDWAPGEWTDDTSMALAVARVTATGADLNTASGLDAVAAGFVEWYDSNPKDIGNQTRAVLSARNGTAAGMTETARRVNGLKGGNGSLMRTAAVGIAFLDDTDDAADACVRAAAGVGALTHDDDRATQACQLWSHAIRHAVLHGTFDGVHGYLHRVGGDTARYWRPLLAAAETGTPNDFPKNGWVVHALQTAWWAITRADHQSDARHLAAALELAVRAGGDTDTTAAIAGALLGARWGASAVPAPWCRLLHGWPGMDAGDLVRLAALTASGGADDGPGRPTMSRTTPVDRARELATTAHAGQVDKVGAPYIEHPARVAGRVRAAGDGEDAEVVAWLHDVVEDTEITLAASTATSAPSSHERSTRSPGIPTTRGIPTIGGSPPTRSPWS